MPGTHSFFRGAPAWAPAATVLVWMLTASVMQPASANLLFEEPFQYSIGASLAGLNGGSGFAAAWQAGSSTIVAGLNGGGSAVSIAGRQVRELSSTINTSGTSTYISYLMRSSDFTNGNYTGIDLVLGPNTQQLFCGIPWNAQKFGFDAHDSLPIQSIDFTPTTDTTYLVTIGVLPSATSGKVDIKMWATANLVIDPATLVASTPNAELLNSKDQFVFDTLWVDGNMPASLKVSGVAVSPSASEAIGATVSAVPEPSTWVLGAAGLASVCWQTWRRRTRA